VNQMRQYLILSGNSSAKNVVNSVLEPKEKTEVEDEGNDD